MLTGAYIILLCNIWIPLQHKIGTSFQELANNRCAELKIDVPRICMRKKSDCHLREVQCSDGRVVENLCDLGNTPIQCQMRESILVILSCTVFHIPDVGQGVLSILMS